MITDDPVALVEALCRETGLDLDAPADERRRCVEMAAELAALRGSARAERAELLAPLLDAGPYLIGGRLVRFEPRA